MSYFRNQLRFFNKAFFVPQKFRVQNCLISPENLDHEGSADFQIGMTPFGVKPPLQVSISAQFGDKMGLKVSVITGLDLVSTALVKSKNTKIHSSDRVKPGTSGFDRRPALRLLKDIFIHLSWRFWILLGSVILFGAIALLPSMLYRYFALHISTQTTDGLVSHLILFGGLVAVAFLLSSLGSTLSREWVGMRIEAFLRGQVLDQIHRLPLEILDTGQRGDLMTSMSRDIFSVELFFMSSIPGQVRELT